MTNPLANLAIINAGIKKVVVYGDYTDKHGIEALKKGGVEVERIKLEGKKKKVPLKQV